MGKRTTNQEKEQLPAIDQWAEEEFGHVSFKDERLAKRLKKIATDFARRPTSSIPQASGNWAASKAAYRLFDNPGLDAREILENHLLATVERIKAQKRVFAIQDTTALNYTTHPQTEGLGPITSNAEVTKGLFAHTTLVVTEAGIPLGIIDEQITARDPKKYGDSKRRNSKPLEEKESNRWIKSFHTTAQVAAALPQTQIIAMADREADIYELLELAAQRENQVDLLIRAQHNRGVMEPEEKRLWNFLHDRPMAATLGVEVAGGGGKKARVASLSIRFCPVTLKAPSLKGERGSIGLWAVEALEENPPKGVKPLCWKLLSSQEVTTGQQAVEKVQWYKQRWLIEVFHKVLKSGCGIEERQLETAERLENCAAVDLVVAWRVFYLTALGRHLPNNPASGYFAEHEWKALYCFIHRTNVIPERPPGIGEAVRWIAQLGGFLGRKGDGDPGPITLWRGLLRLEDIAEAYLAFNPPTCG